MGQTLLDWLKTQKSKHNPINGPMFQGKATEFCNLFNKPDVQCFSSWIARVCQRYNIVFSKISEEAASAPVGWSTFDPSCVKIMQILTLTILTRPHYFSPNKTLRFKGGELPWRNSYKVSFTFLNSKYTRKTSTWNNV